MTASRKPDSRPPVWRADAMAKIAASVVVLAAVISLLWLVGLAIYDGAISRGFGIALIGGGTAISGALAFLVYQSCRARRYLLHQDFLEHRFAFGAKHFRRVLLFDEIEAASAVGDETDGSGRRFVIVDKGGQRLVLRRHSFHCDEDYDSLLRTLYHRLEDTGQMPRIREGNAHELAAIERIKSQWFTKTTLGFVFLLVIAFGLQRDSGWAHITEINLIYGDLYHLVIAVAVIGSLGFLVERFQGAIKTAIILMAGCLAGTATTLLFLPEESSFAVWGGAYALVGAACHLATRGQPKFATVHPRLGPRIFWVFLFALFPLSVSHPSWLGFATVAIVGLLTGLAASQLLSRLSIHRAIEPAPTQ